MYVYHYDEQTLRQIIREVRPEEEEKMMSQFAQDIERKVKSQFAQEIERKVKSQLAQEIERKVRQGALQEGKEEGLREKAVEIARALLDKGMDIGEVSEISGLSEEEIRKLSAH
ncbi:MAG: hypothetical protein KJO08_06880 [Gammaproteobacteria bacterium]|nr:hypothetical protein [Gammaproteobacteria bacterium]